MASKNVTDCTVSGITNYISTVRKFVISFEVSQTSVYSLLEVIYTVYSFIHKKLLPKKISPISDITLIDNENSRIVYTKLFEMFQLFSIYDEIKFKLDKETGINKTSLPPNLLYIYEQSLDMFCNFTALPFEQVHQQFKKFFKNLTPEATIAFSSHRYENDNFIDITGTKVAEIIEKVRKTSKHSQAYGGRCAWATYIDCPLTTGEYQVTIAEDEERDFIKDNLTPHKTIFFSSKKNIAYFCSFLGPFEKKPYYSHAVFTLEFEIQHEGVPKVQLDAYVADTFYIKSDLYEDDAETIINFAMKHASTEEESPEK